MRLITWHNTQNLMPITKTIMIGRTNFFGPVAFWIFVRLSVLFFLLRPCFQAVSEGLLDLLVKERNQFGLEPITFSLFKCYLLCAKSSSKGAEVFG